MPPITGVFEGDFGGFVKAVNEANLKLTSFEQGGAKVERQMNRVADSLTGRKIVQEATLAAAAVENLGGVSVLTEKELQRLGNTAAEAAEKMRKLGVDVPPEIQKLADASKTTTGFFDDLSQQIVSTAAGFVSAQAIIGGVETAFRSLANFVSSSVDSYANAESAAKKMTVALQAQGNAVPEVIQQYNDLATSFQNTTKFSDDLINQMEALLTEIGDVAPGDMKNALQAATDLASGLGIDLESATRLVGKALEGETGALKRYGIAIDDASLATEGANAIFSQIEKRFGGQAQADLETYAGKVQQLANNWDNIKEAVGKQITQDPIVEAALRDINKAAEDASTGLNLVTQAENAVRAASPAFVGSLIDMARNMALVKNAAAEAADQMNAIKPPAGFILPPSLTAQIDAESKAMAELQATIAGYNATLDVTQQQYANLSKEERDAIGAALDLGVAHKTIQEAFRITPGLLALITKARQEDAEAERKAHAQELHDLDERNKAFEQAAKFQTRLMDDILAHQQDVGATANEQARNHLIKQMNDEIAIVRATDKQTEEEKDHSIALIKAKYDGLIKDIGIDLALITREVTKASGEEVDNAIATLIRLETTLGVSREAIQAQIEKVRELTQAHEHGGNVGADAQDKIRDHADKTTQALQRQLAIVDSEKQSMASTTFAVGGKGLDDKEKTVRTLSGELITPAEAYRRFHTGGSFDVSSIEGARALLNTTPTTPEQLVRQYAGIRGGFEFAAQQYQIEQAVRAAAQATLAAVLPTLTPASQPVHVNVSGVWDSRSKQELTDAVSEGLMARQRPMRQMPTR